MKEFVLSVIVVFGLVKFTTGDQDNSGNEGKHEVTWQSIQPILKKLGDIRKHQMEIHQQIQDMVKEEANRKSKRRNDDEHLLTLPEPEGIAKLRHRKRLQRLPLKKRVSETHREKAEKQMERKDEEYDYGGPDKEDGKIKYKEAKKSKKQRILEETEVEIPAKKNVDDDSDKTAREDTKEKDAKKDEETNKDFGKEDRKRKGNKEEESVKGTETEKETEEDKERKEPVNKEQIVKDVAKADKEEATSKQVEQVSNGSSSAKEAENINDPKQNQNNNNNTISEVKEIVFAKEDRDAVAATHEKDELQKREEPKTLERSEVERCNGGNGSQLQKTVSQNEDSSNDTVTTEGLDLSTNVSTNSSLWKADKESSEEETAQQGEHKNSSTIEPGSMSSPTAVSNVTGTGEVASAKAESQVEVETETDLSQKMESSSSDGITEGNIEEMPLNLHVI